ncbi:MAG: menaquinone biosynthesis decarboxylase [Helicobacter bilis]|uniref:menaquinone biosynthesis decarboxylase n=1 Tax=Helicobacter bilis TaxID=37372 RepID=UPI0026E937E1|nr:menaquinone biosynthesis decarboxylase [Helicobacter bilis]MDD7296778.1 menaquinone biosynthesis decarboxylase [Helicobacter bilis]
MQDFIRFLESHNELKIIDTPLDIELEIPHLAYLEVKKKDSKALLFTRPIHRKHKDSTLSGTSTGCTQHNMQSSNCHAKQSETSQNLDSKPCHTEPLGEVSNMESKKDISPFRNAQHDKKLHPITQMTQDLTYTAHIESNLIESNFNSIDSSKQDSNTTTQNIESFHIPVLMNVFGSQKRLELIATHYNSNADFKSLESIANVMKNLLNLSMPKTFKEKFAKLKELWAMRHVFPKKYKNKPPCQERIYTKDSIDLFSLPILKTWEEDGGRFITMGQVYTRSLDGKSNNIGMYRLQIHSHNELLMHWQIHKDATHFFHEYKRANKLMPVSIAIGGDPLYIWCAQAPMPPKIFELMLYGLIRAKNPLLAECVSNELAVPHDCDIVIEGFVDTNRFAPEGKFGDHTGFYTPIEPYPIMQVSVITMKHNPVYLATVVGKPPLEDKYMGYMTERLFLPLLQTSAHGLIDYSMPENGVFHNLILAKVKTDYPAQSLQTMHTFFGIGQMSFVKHALFVSEEAPSLHKDYKILCDYILDRINTKKLYSTMGNCDALDHACESFAISGKLGIDASGEKLLHNFTEISENDLLKIMKNIANEIESLHIYKHKNPLIICGINKKDTPILEYATRFYETLRQYAAFFIFVDSDNILTNYYMLVWRVVNSIDIARDLKIIKECAFLDATAKGELEGYDREWPKDTLCSKAILNNLKEQGLLEDIDESFYKQFGIL